MTRGEYEDAEFFAAIAAPHVSFPSYASLERGGVVGEAEVVDCVRQSPSRWFVGEYGFVLRNPKATQFRQIKGALGFFDVRAEQLVGSKEWYESQKAILAGSTEALAALDVIFKQKRDE